MKQNNEDRVREFKAAKVLANTFPSKYKWKKWGSNGRTTGIGLIDVANSNMFLQFIYLIDFEKGNLL